MLYFLLTLEPKSGNNYRRYKLAACNHVSLRARHDNCGNEM